MVDETGTPRNIVVIRPLGSGLDEKATEAVSKWKFRPATMNGQTVAMQANIEVNFAFRGACSPMSLGVQIMEVHWNTGSYSGATGYGRGNVVESNVKQGFEFTFSCSRPFLPTEGSGLYPARWKKQDTRLVISTSEIGNPKKHSDCELRMTKQPFIYELRNTTLYTVPMKQ